MHFDFFEHDEQDEPPDDEPPDDEPPDDEPPDDEPGIIIIIIGTWGAAVVGGAMPGTHTLMHGLPEPGAVIEFTELSESFRFHRE